MTDTLAYQIGAAFFLAVLFMAGTMTRELFPSSVFKNIKLTMFAVGALVVAWAVYQESPELRGVLSWPASVKLTPSDVSKAVGAPEKSVKDAAAKPVVRPAPAAHALQSPPVSVVTLPPTQSVAEEPVHIQASSLIGGAQPPIANSPVEPAPAQKNGNPVSRAAKSVGRLLHFGHEEKYQPPVVAPVPASIEEK